MNVERLHAIARAVTADLEATSAVETMRALRDGLQNQVNHPQEATYQQQVGSSLTALTSNMSDSAVDAFPPTWRQVLEELEVDALLGSALATRVRGIFERNQITPAVALEELDAVATSVEDLAEILGRFNSAMTHLGIGAEELTPGHAEVGVLIPRSAVSDELIRLGEEFVQLQKILGPFLEITTGSRPNVNLVSISSSDFSSFIDVAPEAAAFLAVAVERIVALYKNLLEVRRLRQGLADEGMTDEELGAIDRRANSTMSEGIDATVDELIQSRGGGGHPARMNELRIELRHSMNAIANRIDRGYNIEVRAALDEGDDVDANNAQADDRSQALRLIVDVAPKLQFLNPSGRSILSLEEPPAPSD